MRNKNFWILLLLLLAGIVLGGFLGEATKSISLLSWLMLLNLGVLVITFGLTIRITMASIIGVAIALLIYRFL